MTNDIPQNNYDLEERTLKFSVRIVKHCVRIKQPAMQPITAQLIRSATSVGANYAEANNAISKQDFRSKIYIAKKEAAETRYWLRLLAELGDNDSELKSLLNETQEILMILQKIANSLKKKSEN
jgi:four helix bundle protein